MKGAFKTGVTLIELTVAMSLLAIISYLVLSSTLSSRTTSTVAQASIFINAQAFQAASSITSELMTAKSASVITEDSFVDSDAITKYRSIRFMVPVQDANGNLVKTTEGYVKYGDGTTQANYIRYRLVGTSLRREILAPDGTTILSGKTIAQSLPAAPNNSFKTTGNSGSGYNMTLAFSLSTYEGNKLPSPVTLTINIAAIPQN